jgi:predicted chitinase
MPASNPTRKTYEQFLAQMAKESTETKRRFAKQIEFATLRLSQTPGNAPRKI